MTFLEPDIIEWGAQRASCSQILNGTASKKGIEGHGVA